MKLARPLWAALIVAAAAAASLPPAAASDRAGAWEKELYFGRYYPSPELLDDVGTVGMRLHYVASRHFGVLAELGFINRTDIEFDIAPPDVTGLLEYDAFFVDMSLTWQPLKLGRWAFGLYGGPGWSFVSARVRALVDGQPGERPEQIVTGLEDDSFSAHGGASVKWYFGGQGFYLRGTARGRWFEARDGDDLDQEYTLALGF
jgi:hypothetical protein